MAGPILLSDPRLALIPIYETGEGMVDVRERLVVDDRKRDARGAFALVRRSVYNRLIRAEEMLPRGLRLLFVEGYRPPETQAEIFGRYFRSLEAANHGLGHVAIKAMASRYISPPEVAPHCAGAAVDVTLVGEHGDELDMGSPVNASPEDSEGACYTDARVPRSAQINRWLLRDALTAAGFVNYPTEWWHWSFGDRYWAMMTLRVAALYGARAVDEVVDTDGPSGGLEER